MQLMDGKIKCFGDTDVIISNYLQSMDISNKNLLLENNKHRKGNQELTFTKMEILDTDNRLLNYALSGQDIKFRFYYKFKRTKQAKKVVISFVVRDNEIALTNINNIDNGQGSLEIFNNGYFECIWPTFNLTANRYQCSLFCSINDEIADWIDEAFELNVEDGDFYNSGFKIGLQSKFLVKYLWTSKSA